MENNHHPPIDLGALKASKEQKDAAMQAFLTQQGFICNCGKPITFEGFMLIGTSKMTTIGSQGVGMEFKIITFCSHECELYQKEKNDPDMDWMCERSVPETFWFPKVTT